MNYRNVRSYDYSKDSDRESPVGSSKTIPDETLSLQELLEKHTRGQYVAQLTPEFFGEEEWPDFEKMDKVDRQEYARQLRISVNDLRLRLERAKFNETAADTGS